MVLSKCLADSKGVCPGPRGGQLPNLALCLRFPDQTGHSVHGKLITWSTPN